MSEAMSPTEKWIAEKKKEFGKLRSVDIQDQTYVYRMLKRPEYLEIITSADPNNSSAMEEADNKTVEKCVIWPENVKVDNMGAGIPIQLASLVSEFSGFVGQGDTVPEPVEL